MKQVPAKRQIFFADTPSIIVVAMPMILIYKEKIKYERIFYTQIRHFYTLCPQNAPKNPRNRNTFGASCPLNSCVKHSRGSTVDTTVSLHTFMKTVYQYSSNLIIISTLDYFIEQVYVSVLTHRIHPHTKKKTYKNIRNRMTLQKW